MLYLVSGEN